MTDSPKISFSTLTRLNTENLEDVLDQQDKQIFVFSSAGKPIYAYHGNEEKLSSFMATAEALMSVAATSRSESLRYIRQAKEFFLFFFFAFQSCFLSLPPAWPGICLIYIIYTFAGVDVTSLPFWIEALFVS